MTELTTLGKRVKYARRTLADLTQLELAEKIGVKQPTISALEKDESSTTRYIVEIADALNVNAHWLNTGRGRMEKVEIDPSNTNFEASNLKNFAKLEALVAKFELTEEQIKEIEMQAISMAQDFFLSK
ncbi:helix-turn-helix domain-containing protein [Vibrio astriarenae]|uniref:helix-turn-helix domain-containing protein n=1 Tax=Vibrio astriarenae TaxID=1481923 RepID=UPI003735CA42